MVTVQSAKAKGRKLQQQVVAMILKNFPKLKPDDVRSTAMGQSGEDVQLSPAARRLLPISLECKARNNIAVYSWYHQAEQNCPTHCEPVLVIKADRKKPLVLVDAEHYFKLRSKT